MQVSGQLRKIKAQLAEPVKYYLNLDGETVFMNELLNHEITLQFENRILCIAC